MVIAPEVGCMEKSPGDLGVCSKMLYFRRVCIVSGSSLSVAQTTPTVVPTCFGKKKVLNFPELINMFRSIYTFMYLSIFLTRDIPSLYNTDEDDFKFKT